MGILAELDELVFRVLHGYWKDPTANDPDYVEWKDSMESIRDDRSVPSEGLTDSEWKQADKFAKRIRPVFGAPFKERRLPIRGDKLVDIDRIVKVPWPDDIHIDPISYVSEEGDDVHYISMAADGPNPGGNMHHGAMEYLPGYSDRETMLQSAADIAVLVYRLTGHKPLILTDSKSRNDHAAWCLGDRKNPPRGYGYDKFVSEASA